MSKQNKSEIEKALDDMKLIQEALNSNTKEILRSTAKEEIDAIVKESLTEDEEEDFEEVDVETDDLGDETETDDSELETDDLGDDLSLDDLSGEYETDLPDELDMTMASDEDVIAVYKKLTGSDEIEIVKDNNDLKVNVNEPGEFIVKMDDGTEISGDDELELDLEDSEDVEPIYEVELDETTNIDGTKAPVGSEDDNWAGDNLDGGFDEDKPHAKGEGPMVMKEDDESEEEICEDDESVEENLGHTRGYAGRQGAKKVGAAHHPKPKNEAVQKRVNENRKGRNDLVNEVQGKFKTLITETKQLKNKNEEYKKALGKFRNMLAETVVFNSNLTYVTKLFVEHSTTKEEKQQILKRFDENANTLKESKQLYKSIVNELGNKTSITQSINEKVDKKVTSSSSKMVNETTAYVDKETSRIKDLINRVENR